MKKKRVVPGKIDHRLRNFNEIVAPDDEHVYISKNLLGPQLPLVMRQLVMGP